MKKDTELRSDIVSVSTTNTIFRCGENGITKILEAQRYAEFCMVIYYEIYCGEHHWKDIHSFVEVEYI